METLKQQQHHPLIYITGAASVGKTFSARTVFQDAISIPSKAHFTPQLLFERILSDFAKFKPVFPHYHTYARCQDSNEFLVLLLELLENTQQNTPAHLILDQVESLDAQLLRFMIQLPELTQGKLHLILISRLAWQDLYKKSGAIAPCIIEFPPLKKQDMLDIIALDCPPDQDLDFYLTFAKIIYETFSKPCRNLNEMRFLINALFPKYIEPIQQGKATHAQTSKLLGNISSLLKDMMNTLYLRQCSQSDLKREHELVSTTLHQFDLPYYTKFLLMASFLASFNPARLDVRFFSKAKEEKIKMRKSGHVNGTKIRQQLLGPRIFPMDRLLAIFYAILEEPMEDSVAIIHQVSHLISLGLILRISAADRLDVIKLKCSASYSMVRQVGRSVRFEISNYLYNWIDVE